MMEVTQNVELKELATEDEIIRSIAEELDHEVDKLTTPDIKKTVESRKSASDEEIHNGLEADVLEPDIEAALSIDSIGKSIDQIASEALPCERNAGTDLDALLDKISSIVDCDPKESVDEEAAEESVAVEADSESLAADIDNNEKSNIVIDEAAAKQIGAEGEQKEEENDNSVEKPVGADLVEAEEKIQEEEEDLEKGENKQNIAANEDEAAAEKDVLAEENMVVGKEEDSEISKTDKSKADDEKTNLNNSSDEVFMDALENISSSDEFEALADQQIKKPDEPTPRKECKNGLEDITSDESNDKAELANDKAKVDISIIDLDSSDECLAAEATTELPKDSSDNPAKEAAEKSETAAKDAEPKKLGKPDDKEEDKEIKMTATQELKENTLDEMLTEAANTSEANSKEAQTKKADTEIECEVPVLPNNKVVETNGVFDKDLAKADEESEEQAPSKASEKIEADTKEAESDDEVIFFEPIEKSAKEPEADESKTEAVKDMSTAEKKAEEVVLVSEDEDEQPPAKKPEEAPSKKSETTAATAATDSQANGAVSSDLLADNSDNACDQFEKLKTQEKLKVSSGEDVDSNSSNLLQPSQKSRDEVAAEAEAEPVAETEDGDVEMVGDEPEDEPDAGLPAVKRIRLSTEDKPEASSSSSCTTANTTTNDEEALPAVAKRSHSLLANSSPVEKEETPSKKLKTDDSDSNSSNDGTLQIDLDAHDNTQESEAVAAAAESAKVKPEEKAEPTELALDLKPKPQFKPDVRPLRMEFIKKFRKNFDKMTRHDLEELVLQKVVESMLVKSEFAEIRRQIDNHEITLANYRRKIAEVSKQFLDLETVHKRVLKDLETKNAQFTAPVRITRAVGLQVGMALMKKPSEEARSQASAHTAGSMSAPAAAGMPTPPKASTSPMRTPMRNNAPRPGPSPPHHQQQQQLLQTQQQQQTPPPLHASRPFVQTSGTPPVRRGCMQKVTPQRPVNNTPSGQQASSPNQGMQRIQSLPHVTSRPMYASKHTGGTNAATAAAVAAAMRARGTTAKPIGKDYPGSYMTPKQQQQQQQQLQQQQQQQLQQQQQPLPVRIGRSPGKQPISINNKPRAMPIGGGTVSVPMSNATDSGAVAAGFGQPSLAPARPKEKAVIDLTDEDDAAAAAAAAAAAVEASARHRQTPSAAAKRSLQTPPMGPNSRSAGGSVVRVSPMNIPRANAVARQIVNGPVQRSSIGSNVTMQIRSENTPPSGARMRYTHPAPLPLAPPQTFHPDWKLPPSRPVIRISLHDTGIVISWTLEDTGPRFAECVTYQIYAYQETSNDPSTDSWRHVGDVKAMLLPMAVTLNQFQENQRYFFAVRGVDAHERYGVFSLPKTW
ncbi:activating transcription factor 7-interacting protein 1 [Drosophila novamexicana]|uniref:activating transcription factor 7-interacting protein 1 n=1 Tax=Drosophila novamexicana TaxID=47314 RepID=UPI0011E5A087|nr:activating transcription factor 7-interacting protein 1 [Drosophila novamexicana]XP_030558282.1 activating transcription factor 7-interacting protein 1 [Drosophila novamexicana]